jgi:hypothetical protein
MEDKIKKMEHRVDYLIKSANKYFNRHGWDKGYDSIIARIEGALDMLTILTEKEYYYGENGLEIEVKEG